MAAEKRRPVDVLLLIDRLDDMVRNGAPAHLGAQVRLNREAAFQLVDELRAIVPEEIRQARWIGSAREEMLTEARLEAERMVAEAREERSRLVGGELLAEKAEQRAEKVLESARASARQIRLGAEGYADDILGSLETGFARLNAVGRRPG